MLDPELLPGGSEMRLSTAVLLVSLLFVLGLAATSFAVPTLVEFQIKDVVGSLDSGKDGDVVAPGNSGGKGKSGEKGSGKPENPGKPGGLGNSGGSADLKSLTLWLSTNGKDWTKLSSDLVSLSSDKITAHLSDKPKDDPAGILQAFDRDITGEPSKVYYVGVSTSQNSYSGGSTMTGRLVSWKLVSKSGTSSGTTAVPEPVLWPLFGAAALGLGYAFRPRRKN